MDLLTDRVDRMQKLLEGILEYSRAGRTQASAEPVNLNELVTEVIEMLAPPENIIITISQHLPTLMVEHTRIQQVFQNLLSNAIKYLDKEEGHITIDALEQDDVWQFNVKDNGPGIEAEYFDQIFDMFKTLNTREEVDSTGVGLSVVKKIVEHYGGRIWVDSKVGAGSVFTFTLSKHHLTENNASVVNADTPVTSR
jgi:signal transduction histidine kinase